jgi:hypothetical protein
MTLGTFRSDLFTTITKDGSPQSVGASVFLDWLFGFIAHVQSYRAGLAATVPFYFVLSAGAGVASRL